MSSVRLLLFTGKGGVGKTTLAAATGATLAQHGRRTLVASTDPAHSLTDVFGVGLGPEPSEVAPRLHAVQIDSRSLVDAAWCDLRASLRSVLTGAGIDALDAEDLTVLPGVDELRALGEVQRLAASGYWHAVVVDCGPTAETLRLLALPEAIESYLEKVFGPGAEGAPSRRINDVGTPLRRIATYVDSLRALLTDESVATVRLVLTPERMAVAETRRMLTTLALRGIRVDGLIANRLMPAAGFWRGGAATWLRKRRAEQDAVLAEMRESGLTAVRGVEYCAREPVGLAALAEISNELYDGGDPLVGDAPPSAQLLQVSPQEHGGYQLRVAIPLATDSAVALARVDDDLAITVDGHRRLVALPELLRPCAITEAESDTEGLVVCLAEPGTMDR